MMKPELISFDLCPFVQRSVITLLEKRVDFDVTYIDLANPPKWFLDVSPFGKVPALKIGGETLFESVVINEYLDDVTPPSMHPADPLLRAINKAWIVFASEMLDAQYHFMVANDEDLFDRKLFEMKRMVSQLESKVSEGPFFNGEQFSLIDAAYAPFFTRAAILEECQDNNLFKLTPKVAAWSAQLVTRESVLNSVKKSFKEDFLKYIENADCYATQELLV